jgi:hypothetical protein
LTPQRRPAGNLRLSVSQGSAADLWKVYRSGKAAGGRFYEKIPAALRLGGFRRWLPSTVGIRKQLIAAARRSVR